MWLRHSSSAPTLKTERKDINKNVKIYQQVSGRGESRPMVLLFGWLLAKPKHLKKFTDFYLEQGFDVLSIQVIVYERDEDQVISLSGWIKNKLLMPLPKHLDSLNIYS